MSRRVKMEDVARETGVSLATVSLVLRDKPGINDETRRRVIDAARAMGYHRRAALDGGVLIGPGQSLRQVGVLMKTRDGDPPQSNPFYGPVVSGIEALCRRQQINLLYGAILVDHDNRPLEVPRMLNEDQIDGILLVGAVIEGEIAALLERRDTPVVLVDAYARSGAYDAVLTDNVLGAYAAVRYLIGQGHRQIALAGSRPGGYPSFDERRRGYVQALAEHAVVDHYFADAHVYTDQFELVLGDLLREAPQVTAILCVNDHAAVAALKVARDLGRRVPEQLSVMGFDNIDLAEHVTPALTTMHIDKLTMGRLALQLLANRIEHPASSPVTALIRPTLVARDSVQPVALGGR